MLNLRNHRQCPAGGFSFFSKNGGPVGQFIVFLPCCGAGNTFVHLPFRDESDFANATWTGRSGLGAAGDHEIQMLDLAIVGGGPGGLMSAWYLKRKLGDLCRVTIFEATARLGGKFPTRKL